MEEEVQVPESVVVVSSINRAIREVIKGGVVVVVIPGEVLFSYDLPTYRYDNDESLHPWMLSALTNHVILLKTDDIKIQRVLDICQLVHFEVFTVLDFPEQKVSGSAFSMVSSLPRILHSELEMFGKVEAAKKDKASEEAEVPAPTVPDNVAPPSSNEADTPAGKFAKITRNL